MCRYLCFAIRAIAFAALLAPLSAHAAAPRDASAIRIPSILSVDRKLPRPQGGLSDLKFQDVFKLPVGPKGLEPTARLLELDGKRVRIVGYMVQQPATPVGSFLLAPLPASVSDEDEPLADDLPPSTIAVVLPVTSTKPVPSLHGLVQVTGVLHVGAAVDAASDRVCAVQITLDPRWAHKLLTHPIATAHDQAVATTAH